MVCLHVKHGDESQFLFDTTVDILIDELVKHITTIYSLRLKVNRICAGNCLFISLCVLQRTSLNHYSKQIPHWTGKFLIIIRNDQKKTKYLSSTFPFPVALITEYCSNITFLLCSVCNINKLLKKIKHLENTSDLNGEKIILDICTGMDWVMSYRGDVAGAPAREPVVSPEDQKQMMLHYYRRQEELKKLEESEDDAYLDSEWADRNMLKRQLQNLNNIKWRPK
uniref:Uncharacterized protein n=1 Tax=Erpetoichthys calabaricus TaxID=27687 RepID=A0A8C4SIQ4_ERPCA